MQPSPYSTEEAANFPGLGDPTLKAEYGRPDRQWENHGEGQGPLRQYNPRPFLDRKMGSADLQTPAPWYTPFDWTGGHWHRWHTRKVDQTGIAIPKEFDEREVKKNDFWAESALSKWASYLVEGSAWDDEWYVERTPQGFWADFFDPAWESMLRSAKIFNDEDMPQWWQNRFRAMGFYIPLIFWFSRRLMRKIWRFETQLTLRTDGRRNESFARRFRYGLGIKRRRKLGPKKRRRIGALTWRRIITGALLFLPVPFFVEQLRRDTTPFAYAVAFGAVGAMFGPRNTMSMVACASVGWFWGAGKEFVQRFEGATMSYLQRTEPIKNDYVRLKVDKLREKLPAKAVADLRLNRVTWLDEHKRDAIGHPWASVKSGHWEDPVDDPRELDLYPDYPWFRPALWRPYMWYIRPYEPVVPDPRRPFNPEDEEAFKAAHVPQAMANIVDRESLQYWMKLREELGFAERDLPDDQGNDDDEYEDEWELEDEGPGVALEMEQDEEVEPALSAPPGIHKELDDNAKMLMRDMLHADVYDWSPVSDSPGWDPEAFMPVDLDDPRLATPELSEQDYANEDYDAFGPDVFADEDE